MHEWKNTWYALIGPLMIWVAFLILVLFLGCIAIVSIDFLPRIGEALAKAVGAFCVFILVPLAAFAEIAPPFVTREKVAWRNRNPEQLFIGDVSWEAVPFRPPVLNRIRSTKRKPSHDEQERVEFRQTAIKT